uniref:disease resistance protein RPV1-like n=1 Tax=Erigeron canadensis TaxID=72917 RepID=UPI001CB943BE|nr:disease resistance protein RPV1-like [Erigeron canadensis]XP_043628757.1 disease resistance protein RPV1-like [Erigeron canadensis]
MEERHKSTIHTAYPVFYDVEPTEIRNQTGSVGEAFSKLGKQDPSAAKWRQALKDAADLAGWELKNTTLNGHEAKLIQKIVEEISLELCFIDSNNDRNLIGMESRVKDVVLALQTDPGDVRMLGIKGMGGGGKTTLARAVFDHISIQFEGKSFLENVREVSKASFSGLKKLQKQVLSDVLHDQRIKVRSVHDGKNMMRKMMSGRKVLIVLDDVDNIEQLEALAAEPKWFKAGSRILITTRDEQVLAAHRVNLICDVNLLSYEESICLFSRCAFGREIPIQGYEELSGNVVSYAAGLPLTIRVLGSFLCGKNELEWKDAIDRLKTIPLRETLEKLELSYIGLEEDYKEIFLDVACILKGWYKDEAVAVLESCGFHARNGLRVLEQKSLITISENGYLGMHDHMEEMGKNIVRRLHPGEPNRHSRLWIQEEIEDILTNDLGTEATKCIKMKITRDYCLETFLKGLGNMKKLRVLDMSGSGDGINTREVLRQCLPNALRYLRWDLYPFESLMQSFLEDHLVGLSLHVSKIIRFWKCGERKVLKKLRFLDMNLSCLRTLDLEMIPNLEKVSLEECSDLVELHIPNECPNLKCISLLNSMLRNLSLGSCPNLEMLSLEECHDLLELRMPFRCPKLKSLSLYCIKLRNLDLGWTSDLETLSLIECRDLAEFCMPSECPRLKCLWLINSAVRNLNLGSTPYLETLWLEECHSLLELHMPFRCPKLKSLSLNCSKLRTLNMGQTSDLETLVLEECLDLVEFQMPNECLKLKWLWLMNSALRNLTLGLTPDLETLWLEDCHDLLELHMPFQCPNLKSLNLNNTKLRTLDLGSCPNLETLSLEECHDLLELRNPFRCPKLKSISLYCSKLRNLDLWLNSDLETLSLVECRDLVDLRMPNECPKLKCLWLINSASRNLSLGSTPDLETLWLEKCHDLLEIHMPFRCPKLKSLSLNCSNLRTLNMGRTSDLETLILKECLDLVEFHMPNKCPKLKCLWLMNSALRNLSLGLTPDLETLWLEECHDLLELHIPFPCPKLKSLNLSNTKLKTLDLAQTPNLEQLDVKECFDLVGLDSPIGCLEKLVYLDLSDCLGFKCFLFDKKIQSPEVVSLHLIAESIDICPLHSDSNLQKFQFSCFYEEPIPSSYGNLGKLISLGICTCTNLESFSRTICDLQCVRKLTLEGSIPEVPQDLDRLACLEELCISNADRIKYLPDSICMMKHLKKLELKSCLLLEKLPEDLGQIECLERLNLTVCILLQDIPNSICKMTRLRQLSLCYCAGVDKLPEEIGSLECLEELNIAGTSIMRLPESIFWLKGLRIISSTETSEYDEMYVPS